MWCCLLLQVGQEDWNLDGKPDLLRFVAEVQSAIDVHSLKLVLQLSYALQVSKAQADEFTCVVVVLLVLASGQQWCCSHAQYGQQQQLLL